MKAADREYQDYTILRVTPTSRGWIVSVSPLWSVALDRRDGGPEPRVGGQVRLYGLGFGFRVRGCDLDGQELFYRTPAEEEARARAVIDAYNRRADR